MPRPLTDRSEGEETECGEIVFKNSTLPWQTGDYEVSMDITMVHNISDACHPRVLVALSP